MRILSATAAPIPVYRWWFPKAFPQAAMPYHDVTRLGFTPCSFMSSIHVQINCDLSQKQYLHIRFTCSCWEVCQIIYDWINGFFENQITITYPFYLKQNWLSFYDVFVTNSRYIFQYLHLWHVYFWISNSGIFWIFFVMYPTFSTLLHLPPLRFNSVGGCWDRTQDCCGFSIGSQTL